MPQIILYVFLGILMDVAVTLYTRAVSCRRKWLATITSAAITIVGLTVIEGIVTSRNLLLIVAYGIGAGIGTLFGMQIRIIDTGDE